MSTVARRQALARRLGDALDAFLVTSLVNVRYLTGFTGSNAALLVPRDGAAVLATDGRYVTQAGDECPGVDIMTSRMCGIDLLGHASTAGWHRVAVERHAITAADLDRLVAAVAGAVELVDRGQLVENLRSVKDDDELRALTTACAVTDEVFAAVLPQLRPGVMETEIAWRLQVEMHERDAAPAFESTVAFGPNSARPHHGPTARALAAGDLVTMDFGAEVDGYHADMTRTVVVGAAADWQRELHALVHDVQADAKRSVRPGAVPVELDAQVRGRIKSAGYEVAHGLGHGVGLQIHEAPFLVPGSTADRLVERVPVTVEPGIYLPGRGGVRIEDTVVVRAGEPQTLTTSPRELIEI